MSKLLIVLLVALGIGTAAFFYFRPAEEAAATGDAEQRIVAYLKENVRPGQPVYVTELYNTVFTSPEEREVIDRLHGLFFKIPGTAARIYTTTGKIPSIQELSDQFGLKIPGEMDVLLKIMESDPRVPRFMERNPATGEITSIDVDRIAADERFGQALRNQ